MTSTDKTLPIISAISWSVCSPTLSCHIKRNPKTDIENSWTADVMSRDYTALLLVIYGLHCWGNDPILIKINKRTWSKWATYPKKLVESKRICEQWTTMTNQALLLKYIRVICSQIASYFVPVSGTVKSRASSASGSKWGKDLIQLPTKCLKRSEIPRAS